MESISVSGIEFNSGIFLKHEEIKATSKKVLEIIKKELPEEAQTFETYKFILENVIETLKNTKFELKL